MDIGNGSNVRASGSNEQRWKNAFYYASHAFRICVATIPFIFFCSLLERLFRATLVVARVCSMPTSQNQGNSSLFAITQGMYPQTLCFFCLFLVCDTALLIASMVLIGRAINRD